MAQDNTSDLTVMARWGDANSSWKKSDQFHWTQHPKVQERLNTLISGRPDVDRFQYFLQKYLHGRLPLARTLTLGCGHGELERGLSKYNLARIHEGVDIATGAIDEARILAAEQGLTHLHYLAADLNSIELPESHYDVVFSVMAMHHIANLEHLFQQVSAALKPDGYFYLDEFIGPTQFQWSDSQLKAINDQLGALPDALKTCVDDASLIKGPVLRPTIEEMNHVDPSEAIRSSEIMPLVSRFFDVVEVKGCGGSLLQMLLDRIAGNFREEDPRSLEYLLSLFNREDELIASGELQHDFAVIVARKKPATHSHKKTIVRNLSKQEIASNIKRLIKQIPPLNKVAQQRDALLAQTVRQTQEIESFKAKLGRLRGELQRALQFKAHYAPGHFYSPVPSLQQLSGRQEAVFERDVTLVPGIEHNVAAQLEWLKTLSAYYCDQPFSEKDSGQTRFHFDNPTFAYTDAFFYYSFLRHLKPKRMVEVGCGYSSRLVLDVNELYFQNSIGCTFIDPFPQALYALLRPGERERLRVIHDYLQEVPMDVFASLEAGDILFVDSSHVSKADSDLNHILFYILPALQRGVYVHFHDVFYPFEYPKKWILQGRAFNECYMLRAFLTHNPDYSIELFASYLWIKHHQLLAEAIPSLCREEGGSLWLQKKGECSLSIAEINELDKMRLTPQSHRQVPASLHVVEIANVTHPQQLGVGWYECDKDLFGRWMSDHAEVRLAGPVRPGQRLWLAAFQPNPAVVTITVSANQLDLGTLQISGPREFKESFVLPDALAGVREILVTIRLDKTWMAPPDVRELGLSFGKIFID